VILTGNPKDLLENHRVATNKTRLDGEVPGQRWLSGIRSRSMHFRDRIRSTPGSRRVYRLAVGIVGLAVTVGGLLLVPLPGPGWLIVFVGLAILASEFRWAQHLLDFARGRLRTWTQWLRQQAPWVRVLVGLVTAAFVAGVVYVIALWRGVPDWVPEVLVPPLPGL
jgi:uncharacterized protein (TIGR02611 family)